MKRIAIILGLLFSISLISGCLEIEYRMKINDDASEDIVIDVTFPAIFANKSADAIKIMKDQGYLVTTKTVKDKYIINATKKIDKGVWILPMPQKFVEGSVVKPSFFNYLFFKTFSMEGSYLITDNKSGDQTNPFSQMQIPLRYFIEVPGTIRNHNAAKMSNNVLQWEYDLNSDNEKVDIKFNSYTVNYLNIVIFAILILVSVLIIFLRPQYKKQCITFLIVLFLSVPVLVWSINQSSFKSSDLIEGSKKMEISSKAAESPAVGPSAPISSPPMKSSNEEIKIQTEKILEDYLTAVENRNVDSVISFYGNEVDYFKSGVVNKEFIRQDKSSYFKRWTMIKTTLMGEPQINLQGDDIVSVTFGTNWIVQNDKKTIQGTADNTWRLRKTGEGLKIIDEKQTVTSRNN